MKYSKKVNSVSRISGKTIAINIVAVLLVLVISGGVTFWGVVFGT